MSEIKVNSIKGVGASAAAITVDNTSGSASANLTAVNSVVMPNGGFFSNRNLIINGAMQVAQRGTSSTANDYLIDRFRFSYGGTDEAPTQAQVDVASGTTPYTLGFKKALKITNGNQTSGAGAADFLEFYQYLEDQDISNSGWNFKSSSSYITISYWVKSSVAQKFTGFLYTNQAGAGDSYMYSYQIDDGSGGNLTADTWTKITHSIAGNSNLTFNSDNTRGLAVGFYMFEGTDYSTSSHTENTWAAWNSSNKIKDMTSTWYTTNDATFEITGVQLEVGNVATSFEHRTYAQELVLCQRYYRQQTKSRASGRLGGSVNYVAMVSYPLSPHMRNTPSVAMYGSANYNSNVSSIGTVNIAYDHVGFTANISDGNYYYYNNGWTADAEL